MTQLDVGQLHYVSFFFLSLSPFAWNLDTLRGWDQKYGQPALEGCLLMICWFEYVAAFCWDLTRLR